MPETGGRSETLQYCDFVELLQRRPAEEEQQ